MNLTPHTKAAKMLSLLLISSALAACGGGEELPADAQLATVTAAGPTRAMTVGSALPNRATPIASATLPSLPTVRFENTTLQLPQSNLPVSFGQVFMAGTLRLGEGLAGRFDDGSTLPLQVDVKALHADGSVRHAVISAVVPTLAPAEVRNLTFIKTGAAASSASIALDSLLGAGFAATVRTTVNGTVYSASADELLKSGKAQAWLAGPVAGEWLVNMPLTDAAGRAHPHLAARFAIRWYEAIKQARVDVVVENDWAYEPNPQNFTYDAEVLVGGKTVYAKPAFNHLHHARWRKLFWWGGAAPTLNVKHNTAYLIASRAVPNYDQTLAVPETRLAALKQAWTGARTEPMGVGLANPYMPSTGGREDIGLMPGWAATWLLSMDQRARDVTLGTADLAGSWSAHYRDKHTGRPVSLIDYPYMTIAGRPGDTYNPVTKKQEAFPLCASGASCATPNTHDAAHQPAMVYLPYLVTGDHYYLEELQFWAMWDAFETNPGYRDNVKGLLKSEQVRAQAWSLRTLAEAAYITPDGDRLKAHFQQILDANLDWYNANYTTNPAANKLGAITNGYSLVYDNNTALAPWQDDFFTSAVGHAAELGSAKAAQLLAWKAQFPVARMTAPGTCWVDGAIYSLKLRDSATAPFYDTMAKAYAASHPASFATLACGGTDMASALKLKVGEMTGYSSSSMGYPSNMQPALAFAVDALGAPGKAAWTVFMNRSVKPTDYKVTPEFAIVPR